MSVVNLAHQAGFPNSVYFHFSFCFLKHSITTPSVPIYFSSLITFVLQKKDYKRYVQDRMQFQRHSYVEGMLECGSHCRIQLLKFIISATLTTGGLVQNTGMPGGQKRDNAKNTSIALAINTKSTNGLVVIGQKSERFMESM